MVEEEDMVNMTDMMKDMMNMTGMMVRYLMACVRVHHLPSSLSLFGMRIPAKNLGMYLWSMD